jgi:predicted nucleotidyltransferase component of viral defense system
VRSGWRELHGEVMDNFLQSLNSQTSDYILKGGTALMECYGLDRFSEDIDLDGTSHGTINSIVARFCAENSYTFRIAKDTPTVLRFMVNYEGVESPAKPLKIEISFRSKNINPALHHKVNGIEVYNIDTLCVSKSNAYIGRDRIRDLYDVCFICKNYWNELSPNSQEALRNAVFQKGFEQFDYIIATQSDELIDNDKLASDFLKAYEVLDIPVDNNELQANFEKNDDYVLDLDEDEEPEKGKETGDDIEIDDDDDLEL